MISDDDARAEGFELANLRDKVKELEQEVERYRAALEPFAEFSRQWKRQPLGGIADEFYTIHTGTEYEAGLRISDCHRAAAALND